MASKNDYFKKVGRSTATTLSSPGYTTGDTSINIGATTNWPTDTGVTFAIDEVGSDGLRKSGTYNVFNGKVSGAGQVSEVEYVGGDPNRNYSAGATTRVYILVSAYRDNKFTDGILVQHKQDGTHSDITSDTLTSGQINTTGHIDVTDTKSIRDGNDNELITFSQTAEAVNEITVKNAATGNAPQIQATGSDTNIDLKLAPKGTGIIDLAAGIGGTGVSGSVSSVANAGTAGGTIWYMNFGGIKLLWFATAAIERAGVGQTSATVTLPASFFSTIQSITGSWKVTADGRNVAYHTTSSTSSITIQIYNYTAGTGGIATFHGFVIGT